MPILDICVVPFLSLSLSLTLCCQLRVALHGFMFPCVLNEGEENYNATETPNIKNTSLNLSPFVLCRPQPDFGLNIFSCLTSNENLDNLDI